MLEITWGGMLFIWFWAVIISFSVSFAVRAAQNMLGRM